MNQINLIDRLQNPNDQQAWQEFDNSYRLLIYNSAIYYGLASQDAEDFTQNLLLKLWNKIPQSTYNRKKGEFQSWLKRVIYNSAMDFHRSANTEMKKLDSFPDLKLEPELDLLAKEEWETYIIARILKRLKSHFSGKALKVFKMCLEGRRTDEISTVMSISENTVYQLKRRVKTKIIQEMKLLSI